MALKITDHVRPIGELIVLRALGPQAWRSYARVGKLALIKHQRYGNISFGTIGSRLRGAFLDFAARAAAPGGLHKRAVGLLRSNRSTRYHFRPSLQLVEIVSPLLHHLPPLGKMRCPVVGAPVRVAHCMG